MNSEPAKESDNEPSEITTSEMNATQNICNQLNLSNPLYQEEISTYTIPISFCALP